VSVFQSFDANDPVVGDRGPIMACNEPQITDAGEHSQSHVLVVDVLWTAGLQSFDGLIKLVICISSVMGPFACLRHVCLRFLGIPIINSSSSFILCVHVWKQKTRLWRETILCGITGRIYLEARICEGGNLGYYYNQLHYII